MELTVELIGPERATRYLETCIHGRRVLDRVVRRYAEIMSRGEWQCDGSTIKFTADGNLCDGLHRLLAVVQSDAQIRVPVLRGVDPRGVFCER